MSIQISRTHDLIKDALDYRAMRQDMIASNIANADTPFYKPRDIRFEDVLAQKEAKILKKDNNKLEMAITSPKHISAKEIDQDFEPTIYFRDGQMARNDGNSVDIDVETTQMSKNSVMFNALIRANKKDTMIFRSVIEASQKVN